VLELVLAFTNTIVFCAASRLSLLRREVWEQPHADQLRFAAAVDMHAEKMDCCLALSHHRLLD
jgi:hypothetical protein